MGFRAGWVAGIGTMVLGWMLTGAMEKCSLLQATRHMLWKQVVERPRQRHMLWKPVVERQNATRGAQTGGRMSCRSHVRWISVHGVRECQCMGDGREGELEQ